MLWHGLSKCTQLTQDKNVCQDSRHLGSYGEIVMITWVSIPEELNLQKHQCDNIKPQTIFPVWTQHWTVQHININAGAYSSVTVEHFKLSTFTTLYKLALGFYKLLCKIWQK